MNKKQIEAHSYYKEMRPDALVLYRIGDNYVALAEDADTVARSLSYVTMLDSDVASFPASDKESISKLRNDVEKICVVMCRNDIGQYDYPNVKRIKEEKLEDF